MKNQEQPIRLYFCRNSAFEAAIRNELARCEIDDAVELEAVPCGGKIDPRYILKAFESGVPGVCVMTCPKGECRMMEGNLRAIRRVQAARALIGEAGLDPESVQICLRTDENDDIFDKMTQAIARLQRAAKPVHEVVR